MALKYNARRSSKFVIRRFDKNVEERSDKVLTTIPSSEYNPTRHATRFSARSEKIYWGFFVAFKRLRQLVSTWFMHTFKIQVNVRREMIRISYFQRQSSLLYGTDSINISGKSQFPYSWLAFFGNIQRFRLFLNSLSWLHHLIWQQTWCQCWSTLLPNLPNSIPPALTVFQSPEHYYRMRAEFRIWHTDDDLFYAMFEDAMRTIKKQSFVFDEFPIADKSINVLMPKLLAAFRSTINF